VKINLIFDFELPPVLEKGSNVCHRSNFHIGNSVSSAHSKRAHDMVARFYAQILHPVYSSSACHASRDVALCCARICERTDAGFTGQCIRARRRRQNDGRWRWESSRELKICELWVCHTFVTHLYGF